jgi:integrase/recombinase XerD
MSVLGPAQVSGPLQPYAQGFEEDLAAQGYTPSSAAALLWLMATLSRWLARNGLGVADLGTAEVDQFVQERRARGRTRFVSSRALIPLLEYLRGLDVAPPPCVDLADTPVGQLLVRYRGYLLGERGLAEGTVRYYEDAARLLLSRRAEADLALEELTAAEVSGFVLRECRRRSAGSAKNLVTALRSLLRFLYLDGAVGSQLASAVPTVAHWRGAGLPRALPAGQLARLLDSCDRQTATGCRDYAILLLLGRLGLRAGEVAALTLDDIDWRQGEIIVHGKGNRVDRLPLPVDVGEALVSYLSQGRPRVDLRNLFVRVRAPHRGLSTGGVQAAVAAAGMRAGVVGVSAHRLRHTAATEMLRSGAGLVEIGQVLRHRDISTTSLYAKVDHAALRTLALPWPGGAA